ncbi:MAG: bifunctional YncE family protein/alkaline phosphatase family protein [Verrucomicrobia bacterium]|nr:bifunctional YncE family protein/alkaline phosphatase family protein [Verrucomicrobiota bacterium]
MHPFLRLSLGLGFVSLLGCQHTPQSTRAPGASERVGRQGTNRVVTPVNQVVTPLGRQIDLPGLRPQGLALSPDGTLLITSGKTSELIVIDPSTGEIRQRVPLPSASQTEPQPSVPSSNILKPDTDAILSFTGLVFSPDGRHIVLSNVKGSLKVFEVSPDGTVRGSHSLALPPANAPRRKEEIPAGLAFSRNGQRLYVCGNLSNTLLELEFPSGKVLRTFPVGVAPYDVVLVGTEAYVSNWGGRRPEAGDLTGPAGRGTEIRVDPVRRIASEGSVSILDLAPTATNPRVTEVVTGLHASALALSPNGKHLACANAGSDTVSVLDTRTHALVETIWVKPKPSDLFGASPNALAFDRSGRRLYVANGTQNAIAVVDFDPADKESRLEGLIPAGWFPGALVFDPVRQQLNVANIKGHAAQPKDAREGSPGAKGFNSHMYSGSLSLIPIPKNRDLAKLSETVWRNLRRERISQALLPARPDQPPRAIPERIGEPSPIRHVVYVIKENRTYDQVLGDIPGANGDPSLCIFGERFTPNQHRMAREFVLLDNTYCAGILSADGHQWSTTAFSTDYMEKSFAGFPRSYPDGMGEDENDALAYSPAGFIWDSALRHGISIRNYGEFMAPAVRWLEAKRKGSPDFTACYRSWKGSANEVLFASYPMIETIQKFSPTNYVGWEMSVPDQHRADFIIRELEEFTRKGEFPQLTIICLPNDHTSGTSRGTPTPAACVADNDLAFGRIVEALSHSPFWKHMAILGIEDDPQAGWDHVSGYRTTAYAVSPYAKRGAVVSTQYNTTSLLRTIGQILGMKPMNQFDASALPMWDAFTDTPDFTPFSALPTQIPLDQMNPDPKALTDPVLRADAIASGRMNFREVDRAPEDELNRILWRSMKGTREPYPEWAISADAEEEEEEEER